MKELKEYDVELKLTEKAKRTILEFEASSEDDLEDKVREMIIENFWDFIDFDYETEYTEQELEEIRADEEYDRIHG